MTSLSQLETYTNDLTNAVKTFADHVRDTGFGSSPDLLVPCDASWEVYSARRNVLTVMARLQILLAEPTDFIQHLASQVRGLSYLGVESYLIVLYRINSSPVCSGWASSRSLRASRSVAASLPKTSPTSPMYLSRSCVKLCV